MLSSNLPNLRAASQQLQPAAVRPVKAVGLNAHIAQVATPTPPALQQKWAADANGQYRPEADTWGFRGQLIAAGGPQRVASFFDGLYAHLAAATKAQPPTTENAPGNPAGSTLSTTA